MNVRIKKYIVDIQISIEKIEKFTEGLVNFKEYESDIKTQSAVERQLVIIREAFNKIKKIDESILIQNFSQIIGFRNRLVHAYDSIDNSIVWAILKRYIPMLKNEINKLKD